MLSTDSADHFSSRGFWRTARRLAARGGEKVLGAALTLYFCLRDAETPTWARTVIVGALGYLIMPVDLIPDAVIGAGYTDDWAVIIAALASVASHIKDEHKQRSADILRRFFGNRFE